MDYFVLLLDEGREKTTKTTTKNPGRRKSNASQQCSAEKKKKEWCLASKPRCRPVHSNLIRPSAVVRRVNWKKRSMQFDSKLVIMAPNCRGIRLTLVRNFTQRFPRIGKFSIHTNFLVAWYVQPVRERLETVIVLRNIVYYTLAFNIAMLRHRLC